MRGRVSSLLTLTAAAAAFSFAFAGVAHAVGAPELDPGNAASGLALLIGGAMLIIERHRRR